MGTTIEFDDDTGKAVEALQRERGLGVSEAVNALIRQALLPRPTAKPFVQKTHPLGLPIDVSNVAGALEVLEGVDNR